MSLFYRNQVLFQQLLKQQNMFLARLSLDKSVDDIESRPGGRKKSVKKQPAKMIMSRPKKKFRSAHELGLNL